MMMNMLLSSLCWATSALVNCDMMAAVWCGGIETDGQKKLKYVQVGIRDRSRRRRRRQTSKSKDV